MYPTRELNRLAAHKAACRRSLARHRAQCVRATRRVVVPLAALTAIPLGLLLPRSSAPRPRLLAAVLQWGPTARGILRHLRVTPPL